MENTNVDKIWEEAQKIIELKKKNKLTQESFENEMALECDYLNTKFPFIFKMVCGDNADLKKLKFMLENITSIKNNRISEHDASVKVGQLLVDEYVKPKLD